MLHFTTLQFSAQTMKLFLATLLLVTLVVSPSFIQTSIAGSIIWSNYELGLCSLKGYCNSKCQQRCSKAGLADRCLKYCGICCEVCKCVPSGTYGNKHECPCYRDKKNSKGKPKCP
ncbi:hypothetical protein RND71_027682 [Anisodus tanguticus]|uniref:Snakin-1 n=1 Tax=Anisodus tanguticus TaxID=243964 RepID=A0AAE1V8D2_9SOLA|nr:hypothetical protein RND71_027682 [Anisodus tanguticus]